MFGFVEVCKDLLILVKLKDHVGVFSFLFRSLFRSIVSFIVDVGFGIRFAFKICLIIGTRGVFLAVDILKLFNIACLVLCSIGLMLDS